MMDGVKKPRSDNNQTWFVMTWFAYAVVTGARKFSVGNALANNQKPTKYIAVYPI